MGGLPDTYRRPIMLYYFAEMPQKEIIQALVVPESTLRSQLRRGKALLYGGFLYVRLGDIPLPNLPEVKRLDELAFTDQAENAIMDSNMNGLQAYLTFPGEEGYILMQLHPKGREYISAYVEEPEVGVGRCNLLVSELTGDIETITWRLRMGEETYLEIVSEHRPYAQSLAFVQGITAKK